MRHVAGLRMSRRVPCEETFLPHSRESGIHPDVIDRHENHHDDAHHVDTPREAESTGTVALDEEASISVKSFLEYLKSGQRTS